MRPRTKPKITDLDAYMNKNHGHLLKPEVDEAIPTKQSIEPKLSPKPADTPTPTPRKTTAGTPTPVPRINIFSPAKNLGNFKPQNILSPATPTLDISKAGRINLMEPVESTLKKMNAGDRIKAYIKRNSVQKDLKEVNQEASKIQRLFRNTQARKKRNAIEVSQRPMPARLSGVHETTRQGATKTRIHEQNQAIEQLRQQKPKRPSTGTEISNATTAAPQAEKRSVGRPKGSGAPKPMRIEYDRPGRPKSMRDPDEPVSEQIKTPKLRMPKKK